MIVVKVTPDYISIQGHANYAESGKDIVCAAVSALTFTLINSISQLTDDTIEASGENQGNIFVKLKSLSDKGRLLIDSFFIGICSIANEYPKCVQLA